MNLPKTDLFASSVYLWVLRSCSERERFRPTPSILKESTRVVYKEARVLFSQKFNEKEVGCVATQMDLFLEQGTRKMYDRFFRQEMKISRKSFSHAEEARLKDEIRTASFYDDRIYKKGYCELKLQKRSGGKRSISIPHPDLKFMQKAILRYLSAKYPAHEVAYGFVKKRSYADCAEAMSEARRIFPHAMFFDVKDAFPSIKKKDVYDALNKFGVDRDMAKRIAFFCCHPKGFLPQGSPASPHLLNMVYYSMDERLSEYCSGNEISYFRYADNLFFFAKEPFSSSDHLWEIIKIAENEGRKIHPPVVVDNPKKDIRALGLNILSEKGGIDLPPETKKKFRLILYNASKNTEYFEAARGVIANLKMVYNGRIPERFIKQIQKHPISRPGRRK